MATQVKVFEYVDANAGGGASIGDNPIIFRSNTTISTDLDLSKGPLSIPIAGTNYSYEKWLRLHLDWDNAGDGDAYKNFELYYDAGIPDTTGVAISVNATAVLVAPSGGNSTVATLSLFDQTAAAPLALTVADQEYRLAAPGGGDDWLRVLDGAGFGKYFVLQMDILNTATPGEFQEVYGEGSLVVRYDVVVA
jgi:hypothetical protein